MSVQSRGTHTSMIEVRTLIKHFGRLSVLRGLDLSVKKGEFVALFGRNGAGKTTLLRILAGLSRASSGSCVVASSASRPAAATRGSIGYLSHNTSLYPDLTALENLRFFAQLMTAPQDDSFLMQRIAEVGLTGRERTPVRAYSRGMQQRLGIARALLHDPEILLMDEPFTGLDQAGAALLKSRLLEAHARGGTCIMAVHDMQLGYELADRLIVIEKGVAALDVARSSVSFGDFRERCSALTADHTGASA